MENAVIINRISSQRQEDGYSLAEQSKLNNKVAEDRGYRVIREFNIIESAKDSSRRGKFREAFDYIKKDTSIRCVIVEKIDRLTRNLADASRSYELVNDYEIKFIFTKDNQEFSSSSKSGEKLQFDLKAILAKNYIDNLSEEVKKGQRGMLESGRWAGGSAPTGYLKENKQLIPDPDRSHFISKIFELYSSGAHSIKSLKREVDSIGFRSRRGKLLSRSNYYHILTNPIYYGDMRWNNNIFKGCHQPLINKSTFDRVNEMLCRTKNGLVTPAYSKHDFTYRGVLQCAECSSKITAEQKTKQNLGDKKIHKWTYYRCTHSKPCNQKGSVREELIECEIEKVLSKLKLGKNTAMWLKDQLRSSRKQEIEFRQNTLSTLNLSNNNLQKRLDTLYDDKIDGLIDIDTYDRKRNQYLLEQEQVLSEIQKHTTADKEYVNLGSLIIDVANNASSIYKVRSSEEKRYLLKLVFSNLYLKDKKLEYSFNPIFNTLLNYQKSNVVLRD